MPHVNPNPASRDAEDKTVNTGRKQIQNVTNRGY